MNLLNFIEAFPDEASCRFKFKKYRDKHGVFVPSVVVRSIIGRKTRSVYECKGCKTVKTYAVPL